jgi:hypothetical protein
VFHLHRRVENGAECSESLAFELQMPVNHPEESIEHSEHCERVKTRIFTITLSLDTVFDMVIRGICVHAARKFLS